MITLDRVFMPFTHIADYPWLLAWLSLMISLACISDLKTLKIPNKLNAVLLSGNILLFVLPVLLKGEFRSGLDYLLSAGLGFIVLLLPAVFTGFKMAGDIKFVGALGFAFNPEGMIAFLLLSIVLNLVTNSTLIALKKKTYEAVIPFAPFFAGSFILLLIASHII